MASTLLYFSLLLILPTAYTTTPPQNTQFDAIIDAIVGAGDFSNWANLLSQTDTSLFPLSATLLIPDNDAFVSDASPPSTSFSLNFVDPLLFTYHIIPRRFTFSELLLFPIGARLPTLLPENTLLITNNSVTNFTINGALISRPDLFHSSIMSVHGVSRVLDYTQFGKVVLSPESSPVSQNPNPDLNFLEVEKNAGSSICANQGTQFWVLWFIVHVSLFLITPISISL
ncbi:fasciclin-like arabinogalactan protein 21 [Amaranthus tricolor]|uniref:fasciclin-like arabinogalactan protein 21 n=1 Tax=Amaranthus tricolor TaxID=29722 RepID=UPI00258CF360|nr:fasciclin-like arabinogalactan protein 21 [Amaranthus tricolor]